jgi:hypothetical protein
MPPKFEFMNPMRLLGDVWNPVYRRKLVPSGTMLQVSVAGSPFPVRGPEAVESQGSGPDELRMKPLAGVAANSASEATTNDKDAARLRIIDSSRAIRKDTIEPRRLVPLNNTRCPISS